ncbi:MAG TPA: hypothetical protein VMY37_24680 [Thermoguttaceae bacterium]|nr:hypothetical protein [Thermoguttaceae bacterium]
MDRKDLDYKRLMDLDGLVRIVKAENCAVGFASTTTKGFVLAAEDWYCDYRYLLQYDSVWRLAARVFDFARDFYRQVELPGLLQLSVGLLGVAKQIMVLDPHREPPGHRFPDDTFRADVTADAYRFVDEDAATVYSIEWDLRRDLAFGFGVEPPD